MRFIRQEKIITTICNSEVIDTENIARLLEKLKEESLYFSLTVMKMGYINYANKPLIHKKVKVNEVYVEESKVDFYVYGDTLLIKLNNVDFCEIVEIFALTEKVNLLSHNKDKGVFDFIDLEE